MTEIGAFLEVHSLMSDGDSVWRRQEEPTFIRCDQIAMVYPSSVTRAEADAKSTEVVLVTGEHRLVSGSSQEIFAAISFAGNLVGKDPPKSCEECADDI